MLYSRYELARMTPEEALRGTIYESAKPQTAERLHVVAWAQAWRQEGGWRARLWLTLVCLLPDALGWRWARWQMRRDGEG